MKREELLQKLGFTVGHYKKKRVLILSDIKTEADDPYAIVQHLLSPTEEICGIVACHFESKFHKSPQLAPYRGTSAQMSYEEGQKLLELLDLEDVPLVLGATGPLPDDGTLPASAGAELIVAEAMREDTRPLYVACLGALTDLAIALQRCPEIAARMTAILIAGGAYPYGGPEPNVEQDVRAAQQVFSSPLPLWQIPADVYRTCEVSLAELASRVRPCGRVGAYLWQQLVAVNDFYAQVPFPMAWPHGETWCLGDNPTAFVLLQSQNRCTWHTRPAPRIGDDMTYIDDPSGKEIRVYDSLDTRLGFEDLFAKLALCCGQ